MDNQEDLLRLREARVACVNKINEYKALKSLMSNTEFKDLIMTNYCVNSCADFMSVYSNTTLLDSVRNNALEAGKACGHLKCYLDTILQRGRLAEEELIEVDQVIDSLEHSPETEE